ncbi:hypothetical protein [Ensifer sp. LCM 4579]|uniref:hypothetical protein n=1 Tax=Ensifer sp. LCM 4579 TaxID=1848292 RepID=UPI0008D98BCD|nr:hypothetical protein [Ensifer sp. LCM 4579]OHV73340.1 hypothetical protein LCM4579_10490 [Ensifer sp. LCM 4579]
MPAHSIAANETHDGRRDTTAAVVFSAIEFGKRYHTRKGKIVGPLAFDAESRWPWRDPKSDDAWTIKGRFSQDIDSDGDAPDHPSDIVAECVDKLSIVNVRLVPRIDPDFAEVSKSVSCRDLTVSVCIGLGTILADVRANAETGDVLFVERAEFKPHGGASTSVEVSRLSGLAVLRGGAWVPVLDVLAARVREEVAA